MRLKQFADFHNPRSLASRMRRRRFDFFRRLLLGIRPGARVLDVGGTPEFWVHDELVQDGRIQVTLVNLETYTSLDPRIAQIHCDARDMGVFEDNSFDAVFSNSVIEHVGSYADQQRMAHEIQRVARRFFVQTPNYWFPLEPHFLIPLFQFYPTSVRARLVQKHQLGWMPRQPVYENALAEVRQIRLLTAGEMLRLFPTGVLYRERLAGLTKSLVMYGGWARRGVE